MTTQDARTDVQKAIETLNALGREKDEIRGQIEAAVGRDAERSQEAADRGESPLTVEKEAPALIAREQELAYLIPAAKTRHREAVIADAEERHRQRVRLLEEAKVERDKAEEQAGPYIAARDKARAEEEAARASVSAARFDLTRARQGR